MDTKQLMDFGAFQAAQAAIAQAARRDYVEVLEGEVKELRAIVAAFAVLVTELQTGS